MRMRLKVVRDRSMAVSTSLSASRMSTKLAASMAMSAPAPMATPMSAAAKAGASLTPSPTIATTCPLALRSATMPALPPGSTSARTFDGSIPAAYATASAVARLSPVIMWTSMPSFSSPLTTADASGLIGSAMPNAATNTPLQAATMGVRAKRAHSDTNCWARSMLTPSSCRKAGLPTSMVVPSTSHLTPRPGTASKFSTPSLAMDRPATSLRQKFTMALASGCSELPSAAPTRASTRSRVRLGSCASMACSSKTSTLGRPRVRVPVLSKVIAVTR
mmetsp:Transcript_4417/g.17727  ORF Transcript_4417/g.17727 Transcript_4417/m.17727 type:complete len:276 (-) Transcript_4417:1986-2813(-)